MEISKNELIRLYRNCTNRELCEKFSISEPTLIKLLVANDIPLKGKGNHNDTHKIKVIN